MFYFVSTNRVQYQCVAEKDIENPNVLDTEHGYNK